jgi:hypothetical protein
VKLLPLQQIIQAEQQQRDGAEEGDQVCFYAHSSVVFGRGKGITNHSISYGGNVLKGQSIRLKLPAVPQTSNSIQGKLNYIQTSK